MTENERKELSEQNQLNELGEEKLPSGGGNEQNDDYTYETKPVLTYTDLLYGTLFRPTETFRMIAVNPPVFKCFVIFSLLIMINLLSNMVLLPYTVDQEAVMMIPPDMIRSILPLISIIGAVITYANWFLLTGFFQIFAEFFEGKGSALSILCVLALVELPKVVLLPFNVLGAVFEQASLAAFFSALGSLAFLVWWSYLVVIGIREVHSLTLGKTLLVIASPFLFFVLAFIIITIAGMGLLLQLVSIFTELLNIPNFS